MLRRLSVLLISLAVLGESGVFPGFAVVPVAAGPFDETPSKEPNVKPSDSARPSKSRDEVLARFVAETVKITPGEGIYPQKFQFGTSSSESESIKPREVAMTAHFRMSRYEVTQELYEVVMNENPSRWKGPRNSVESMTFRDAVKFCARLTAMLHEKQLIAANEVVRLPTEVEWEYCCRAGTATRYSFGDDATTPDDKGVKAGLLDAYAWHTGNAAGNDPAVGVLKPNPWGLYDFHGYLWEFVGDSAAGAGDLKASEAGSEGKTAAHILRGGSWKDHWQRLSSTSRRGFGEDQGDDAVGFRCLIAENPQP